MSKEEFYISSDEDENDINKQIDIFSFDKNKKKDKG
jgi:hypothetical protein